MTTIEIINRINNAIIEGDQRDLDNLINEVSDLLIEDELKKAFVDLISTASESIDGAFR